MDCRLVEKTLLRFISDSCAKHGFNRGLVGVSGGLDSAVVLALVCRALGPQNTFALFMPYRLSAPESSIHARLISGKLGVNQTDIDISPAIDSYFSRFPSENDLQLGNKCARERMSVLYDFSQRLKALVIGTSNKSEFLVGYSTQFGDSAAAFFPIGDLYKTQVRELAHYLEIPAEILAKSPSADLWPGQTDEAEIGLTYDELDAILSRLVDRGFTAGEISAAGFAAEKVDRVRELVRNSQFKRTMPPIAKLQERTIGLDFRYLRDWGR